MKKRIHLYITLQDSKINSWYRTVVNLFPKTASSLATDALEYYLKTGKYINIGSVKLNVLTEPDDIAMYIGSEYVLNKLNELKSEGVRPLVLIKDVLTECINIIEDDGVEIIPSPRDTRKILRELEIVEGGASENIQEKTKSVITKQDNEITSNKIELNKVEKHDTIEKLDVIEKHDTIERQRAETTKPISISSTKVLDSPMTSWMPSLDNVPKIRKAGE